MMNPHRLLYLDIGLVVVSGGAVLFNVLAFFKNVSRMPENPALYVLLATLQAGLIVMMWVHARKAWTRVCEARAARRMNVRIVRDGVEIPCRLARLGVNEEGMTEWVIYHPTAQLGDQLRVEVLPPMTALTGVWTDDVDPPN